MASIKLASPIHGSVWRLLGAATRLGILLGVLLPATVQAEIGRFDGYEIRVIRPRYMIKRNRMELGTQGVVVMNQSFIYTMMLSGILDFHLNEMFALEVDGAYGFSIDKEDKRILKSQFNINTQILRTQYQLGGGLLWTPIYGKTQLPNGQVVYFDSFATAQVGMTGIAYNYEQCTTPPADRPDLPQPPNPVTKSYPGVALGVGQKYFVSQDFGLRWDLRDTIFSYQKADGSCTPDQAQGSDVHQNITLQGGVSFFF